MKCPIDFPGCAFQHVGSSFVGVDHPKDIDFLCYVPTHRLVDFFMHIGDKGYVNAGEMYTDTEFTSYRFDNYNLIIITDFTYFCNFRKAAYVCKVLKVEDKDKRIYVHDLFTSPVGDTLPDLEYDTVPF